MNINLNIIVKKILSIFKPDFRKTSAWLFITTGLLLLTPNYMQDIILALLDMHGIVPSESFANSKVIGTIMVSVGIQYHLLYIASEKQYKELEILVSISLLTLIPVMIYLSI